MLQRGGLCNCEFKAKALAGKGSEEQEAASRKQQHTDARGKTARRQKWKMVQLEHHSQSSIG